MILLSILLMILGFLLAILGSSIVSVFLTGVGGLLAGLILMVFTVRKKMKRS